MVNVMRFSRLLQSAIILSFSLNVGCVISGPLQAGKGELGADPDQDGSSIAVRIKAVMVKEEGSAFPAQAAAAALNDLEKGATKDPEPAAPICRVIKGGFQAYCGDKPVPFLIHSRNPVIRPDPQIMFRESGAFKDAPVTKEVVHEIMLPEGMLEALSILATAHVEDFLAKEDQLRKRYGLPSPSKGKEEQAKPKPVRPGPFGQLLHSLVEAVGGGYPVQKAAAQAKGVAREFLFTFSRGMGVLELPPYFQHLQTLLFNLGEHVDDLLSGTEGEGEGRVNAQAVELEPGKLAAFSAEQERHRANFREVCLQLSHSFKVLREWGSPDEIRWGPGELENQTAQLVSKWEVLEEGFGKLRKDWDALDIEVFAVKERDSRLLLRDKEAREAEVDDRLKRYGREENWDGLEKRFLRLDRRDFDLRKEFDHLKEVAARLNERVTKFTTRHGGTARILQQSNGIVYKPSTAYQDFKKTGKAMGQLMGRLRLLEGQFGQFSGLHYVSPSLRDYGFDDFDREPWPQGQGSEGCQLMREACEAKKKQLVEHQRQQKEAYGALQASVAQQLKRVDPDLKALDAEEAAESEGRARVEAEIFAFEQQTGDDDELVLISSEEIQLDKNKKERQRKREALRVEKMNLEAQLRDAKLRLIKTEVFLHHVNEKLVELNDEGTEDLLNEADGHEGVAPQISEEGLDDLSIAALVRALSGNEEAARLLERSIELDDPNNSAL
jgi:hypothetical protein